MWKDLSMQQRADLMDIYLSHGITSLDEMRKHYDSSRKHVYDGTTEDSQQMNRPNIYRYNDGRYVYQAAPDAEEIEVSPINTLLPNPSQWTYQDAEGKVYTPHAAQVDTGSITQSEDTNPLLRAANNYMREAAYRAKDGTLALQGKYTMPVIAASALLPLAGEAAYPLLTNPYVDAAATSGFAGHGLNHAINEGINGWGDAAMTALELAPLGQLAKPVWNTAANTGTALYNDMYIPYKISNAINKGVKENAVITAYNRNPATKDIGNLWDYQSYLDQVFPNTKVKDVLWHGSRSKNLETFDTNMIGSNTPIKNSVGMYLSPNRYVGESYGRRGGAVYPILLNTENPLVHHQIWGLPKNGINVAKISPKVRNTLLKDYDAVIAPERGEIAFFNPNDALILGSDADVAGFREFVGNTPKGLKPGEPLIARGTPEITAENAASMAPKVNWDADNWFKTISGRNSYSAEEAAELASHVPEYRAIEQRLFDEGKLAVDSNGNIVVVGSEMSPQEYIMRQSEAFQKMNPEHHYVGVSKKLRDTFENEARDPATRNRYDVWTDRKSPKNVEEYAISQQGGYTNASQIEKVENQMSIREENHELHKEQLKWKLEHGKISQETYDRDLASLEDNYSIKQKEDGEELKVLRQQEALDPLNGGKVFDVTYPRNAAEAPVIDAEGNHWHSIPYLTVQRDAPVLTSHYQPYDPVNTTVQTDQLVTASRRHGYGVTHIDNVKDTYDGTMLNETIIGRGTPVKSVLGNTGTFDIESPNKWKLYRSLLPPFLGLGAVGALYGKQE